MQPSMREVGRYYRRVLRRGLRESSSAIARNGLIAGLAFALVAVFVQAVLDDEFNLLSTTIAACAGFGVTALTMLAWEVARAPVLIAADDERAAQDQLEATISESQRQKEAIATELEESEAALGRLQVLADRDAPKRALIDQLRKADALRPNLIAGFGNRMRRMISGVAGKPTRSVAGYSRLGN
jgi:hypothetical protein